jgi:hypothetical protein
MRLRGLTRVRPRLVAFAIMIAILALAGCGAHDQIGVRSIAHPSSAAASESKPAPSSYGSRVEAICATADARAREIGRPTGGPSSFEFLIFVGGLLESMHRALARLAPPRPERFAYARFLGALESEAKLTRPLNLDERVGKFEAGYRRRGAEVKAKMVANDLTAKAKAFGVPACTSAAVVISRDREA